MKILRRTFLHLTASAVALPTVSRFAWAQTYPSQTVRIIVPFAPGGATDIIARLIGQRLSERLGQQFVIDNRPGGGGNIGTEAVVRAPADGYTLLMITSSMAMNATLYDKSAFNFPHDIAAIASVSRSPIVMQVHPSVPVKTVREFIAHAKANPGKISFASAGIGTLSHLSGEQFKMMAGVDMIHVPYRGTAPALNDLIGGQQVQVMFDNISSSSPHISTGKVRPLAVTTASPADGFPNIPTVSTFLPGYEASVVTGIGAPKSTPVAIVNRLNNEINAALTDATMKARFAGLNLTPLPASASDYAKLLVDETEKWGRVIKFANIKIQ
jgi:tripartite-type tricarboxylate transporter receptor subunit TctC